jgi:hypothetical protein
MRIAVAAAVAGALLLAAGPGRSAYNASHIGAPALVYPCPTGTFTTEWWVRDSSPVGAGAPGTLEYHGWREIASCASSTTVSG